MLEFFEKLEAEERAKKEAESQANLNYWREEATCEHCGDVMIRFLLTTDHKICWNGWCFKRWFLTQRCFQRQTREAVAERWSGKDIDYVWQLAQDDMAWLKSKGFPIVDPWADMTE